MSYFKLQPNGIINPVREYGTLSNLRRIMDRNNDSFRKFNNLGNRDIQSQNPLVEFLQSFSVNVEWDSPYLINQIESRVNQLASLHDLTSVYNRGKNHPLSIYPESNHNTLLVVPFGKPSVAQINRYLSIPLNELVPLYPIYTTDKEQRYNIIKVIDTQQYKLDVETFTIINVDIYALIIGFYRWLKRGIKWGNTPQGYLANFPLMNCYLYHNELVNFNYLNDEGKYINSPKASFNLESYQVPLIDYTDYKNRHLLTIPMKSFSNFLQVNEKTNPFVDVEKMIYPDAFKSLFFVQMSWVWSLASLGMVKHYLWYNNFVGTVDGLMKSNLAIYYQKVQLQSQLGQIKSDVWEKHFKDVWTSVKEML